MGQAEENIGNKAGTETAMGTGEQMDATGMDGATGAESMRDAERVDASLRPVTGDDAEKMRQMRNDAIKKVVEDFISDGGYDGADADEMAKKIAEAPVAGSATDVPGVDAPAVPSDAADDDPNGGESSDRDDEGAVIVDGPDADSVSTDTGNNASTDDGANGPDTADSANSEAGEESSETGKAARVAVEADVEVIESDVEIVDAEGNVVAEEEIVEIDVTVKADGAVAPSGESGVGAEQATSDNKGDDADDDDDNNAAAEPVETATGTEALQPDDAQEADGGETPEKVDFEHGTPVDFELIPFSELDVTYDKKHVEPRKEGHGKGMGTQDIIGAVRNLTRRNTVLLVATDARSAYIADTTMPCGALEGESDGNKWDLFALKEFLAAARDSDSPSITFIYYTEKDDGGPIRYSCITRERDGKLWVPDDRKWARRHLVDALAAMGLWWIKDALKYKREI